MTPRRDLHAKAFDEKAALPRILVISPEKTLAAKFAEALGENYSVQSATLLEEGLQKALALPPAVIFVSLENDGNTAAYVISEARDFPQLADSSIVLVAGDGDAAALSRTLEEGAHDYLNLPFTKQELHTRLRNLLRLQNAQDKYDTLFDNMDAGFCTMQMIFDEKQRPIDYLFLEANHAFEEHTGLSNARGRRIRDMLPNHDQHWFDTYGHVALSGESVRIERFGEALGRWYSVYAFRTGAPEDKIVAAFFTDITEKKLAQIASEEQNRRQAAFVSVMENSSDLVGMADAHTGQATYINPAGLKLLGLDNRPETWQLVMGEFVWPEDLPSFVKALETASTAGIWEGEMNFRNFSSGAKIPAYQRIWPVMNDKHEKTHFATIATYLTDQKRMDEVMDVLGHQKSLNDELREALDDLQGLAQVVSHELQEPLQIIRSYQNLLAVRYKGRLGEDADEFIAKCSEASATTKRMVDDLWEYAQVIRPVFVPERVSSEEALKKALSELRSTIRDTGAKIDYKNLPEVVANEGLLTAVFFRLIENAIKFRVPTEAPRISITSKNINDMWTFSVQDNAGGIDPMIGRDIFRLFFKGHGRSGPSGTGMGLPVAKKIIEYFGGTMYFEAAPDHGTIFHFTVPNSMMPIR